MNKANPLPPVVMLRLLLDYNPETGEILWKKQVGRGRVGVVAKSSQKNGRLTIMIRGIRYQQSRIAYALHNGVDPYPFEVDHADEDCTNNRAYNLRLATRRENLDNRSRHRLGHSGPRPYQRRPVEVTYPDGRGSIVCDSVQTVVKLLGCSKTQLHRILKREDNQLYWRGGTNGWTPSGIRVSYADTVSNK